MTQRLRSQEQLKRQVARREAEIDVLLEINRRLRSHFELRGLLRDVLNYTRRLLDAEASSIVLRDEETGELFFHETDDDGTRLDEIRLAPGQGIVGQVIKTGNHRIVNDTKSDPDFFDGVDQVTGFQTRNLICVPLLMEGQTAGALEVLNRDGGFEEDEVRLVEIISSQAAMAIEYVKANENRLERERMALLGNMAASIVHDLRNSMSVIHGYSDLLALKAPDHKDLTQVIAGEARKLSAFCHELLDFARGGQASMVLAPVDVRQIMEESASSIEDRFNKHEAELMVTYPKENLSIHMDAMRMGRVLMNLLGNALDALEGGLRKVEMIGKSCEEGALIIIRDTGRGMSQEVMSRLFEPFFTMGKPGGTGLGMAIVKNIMDCHGFELQVESTPGKGSQFTLTLRDEHAGN